MIKLLGKVFGTEKVKIYEKRGARKEWTALKEALKAAGIRKTEANAFQKEPGPVTCGCSLDNRDFGQGGRIDRDMYNIYVRAEDEAAARAVMERVLSVSGNDEE